MINENIRISDLRNAREALVQSVKKVRRQEIKRSEEVRKILAGVDTCRARWTVLLYFFVFSVFYVVLCNPDG